MTDPSFKKEPKKARTPTTCDLYLDLRKAVDELDDLPDGETLDEHDLPVHRDHQLNALERIMKAVEGLDTRQVALAEIQREVSDAEDLYNGHCGELGDAHDHDLLTPDQAERYVKLPCRFEDIVFSSGGRD